MDIWFECKARYDREDKNGVAKKVTESYLLPAVSYTDAEARFYAEMEEFLTGNMFTVHNIAQKRIHEVLYGDGGFWYKLTIAFLEIDPINGKEGTTSKVYIVPSDNIQNSIMTLDAYLESMVVDYELLNVSKTNYIEVFRPILDLRTES